MPDINNFKIWLWSLFGSQFQRFLPTVLGSVKSGAMIRQNTKAAKACVDTQGRQEAERNVEKPGKIQPPKTGHSDLLSPARPHLTAGNQPFNTWTSYPNNNNPPPHTHSAMRTGKLQPCATVCVRSLAFLGQAEGPEASTKTRPCDLWPLFPPLLVSSCLIISRHAKQLRNFQLLN
jgi:hypothetical protein